MTKFIYFPYFSLCFCYTNFSINTIKIFFFFFWENKFWIGLNYFCSWFLLPFKIEFLHFFIFLCSYSFSISLFFFLSLYVSYNSHIVMKISLQSHIRCICNCYIFYVWLCCNIFKNKFFFLSTKTLKNFFSFSYF